MITAALWEARPGRRLDLPTREPGPDTCANLTCARPAAHRGLCWAHYNRLAGRTRIESEPRQVKQEPMTTAELIAELDLLVGTDAPDSIAARLGTNPRTLARRLYRNGRDDLARHFDRRAA